MCSYTKRHPSNLLQFKKRSQQSLLLCCKTDGSYAILNHHFWSLNLLRGMYIEISTECRSKAYCLICFIQNIYLPFLGQAPWRHFLGTSNLQAQQSYSGSSSYHDSLQLILSKPIHLCPLQWREPSILSISNNWVDLHSFSTFYTATDSWRLRQILLLLMLYCKNFVSIFLFLKDG